MDFEWDATKNRENIRKHGFDFSDAWRIFEAPMLTVLDTREDYGEDRWVGLGILGDQIVKVIYVESNEGTIRIVSLRKAIKYERQEFENYFAN